MNIKFSFIIATLNRKEHIGECIESLLQQTYHQFEIIVVDQSDNDETERIVKEILKKNTKRQIKYNHVCYCGLSRARNDALSMAEGDYFCLVDDDATYSENYLETAYDILRCNKYKGSILSGIIYEPHGERTLARYQIAKTKEELSYTKLLLISLSASLIIPTEAWKKCGGFDEDFGAGARYGAAEETDYLIRLKQKNYKIVHVKELIVFHPSTVIGKNNANKAYAYAYGEGALIKKHLFYQKNFFLLGKAFRFICSPLLKLMINLLNDKSIYYIKVFLGHIKGFFDYRKESV